MGAQVLLTCDRCLTVSNITIEEPPPAGWVSAHAHIFGRGGTSECRRWLLCDACAPAFIAAARPMSTDSVKL